MLDGLELNNLLPSRIFILVLKTISMSKDSPTKGSTTGVYVRTWGSEVDNESTGLSHLIDVSIKKQNVGHASVEVVLPDTPENWEMVQKHIGGTPIAAQRKVNETKKVKFTPETGSTPIMTDEVAFSEPVISVYFSWWPSSEDEVDFTFNNLMTDQSDERLGVALSSSSISELQSQASSKGNKGTRSLADEYLTDKRVSGGMVERVITLPPEQVLTLHGATQPQRELLLNHHRVSAIQSDIQAIELLKTKIEKQGGEIVPKALTSSSKLLIQRFFPDFNLTSSKSVSQKKLLENIEKKEKALQQGYSQQLVELYVGMLNLQGQPLIDSVKMTESDWEFRATYNNLSAADRVLQEAESFSDLNVLGKGKINKAIQSHKGLQIIYGDTGLTEENFQGIKNRIHGMTTNPGPDSPKSKFGAIETKRILTNVLEITDEIKALSEVQQAINKYLSKSATADPKSDEVQRLASEALIAIRSNDRLRMMFDEPQGTLSIDNIQNISDYIQRKANPNGSLWNDIYDLVQKGGNQLFQELSKKDLEKLIERFAIIGLPPTHTIQLPIQTESLTGLDPEAMLQEMGEFARQGNRFSIINNNCSVTSLQILAAGSAELNGIFQRRALGNTVATPQMVYVNSLEYGKQIRSYDGPDPADYEVDNSWQKYFLKWAVDSAANFQDSKSSYTSKALSLGSGLTALTAYATTATIGNMFDFDIYGFEEEHLQQLAEEKAQRKAEQQSNPDRKPAYIISSGPSAASTESPKQSAPSIEKDKAPQQEAAQVIGQDDDVDVDKNSKKEQSEERRPKMPGR